MVYELSPRTSALALIPADQRPFYERFFQKDCNIDIESSSTIRDLSESLAEYMALINKEPDLEKRRNLVKNSCAEIALRIAARCGAAEVLETLITLGVPVDATDQDCRNTALMVAATGGHERCAEILLSKGANIEARNKKESTPLIIAACFGKYNIVALLIKWNADVNALDAMQVSALIWAVAKDDYYPKDQNTDWTRVINLLLGAGADINQQDKKGQTALSTAAINNSYHLIELLLGSHANALIKGKYGTALDEAKYFEASKEVVRLLKETAKKQKEEAERLNRKKKAHKKALF